MHLSAWRLWKKSEDDITNKEIYQDDLQPLTEEELNEMDADTSDEDMKQIDEPEDENADSAETADAAKTENTTEKYSKKMLHPQDTTKNFKIVRNTTSFSAYNRQAAEVDCEISD